MIQPWYYLSIKQQEISPLVRDKLLDVQNKLTYD
jgi:hypothetical protein